MTHRGNQQGYRGGQDDRDYNDDRFERSEDRWQRGRDRGAAGSSEHSGRQRDWDEGGYRGREQEFGGEWQGSRYGPGYRERQYEQGRQFRGSTPNRPYGAGERDWGREDRGRGDFASPRDVGGSDWSERDYGYRGSEESDYSGPWGSTGYGQSGFGYPHRYGEPGGYSRSGMNRFSGYESGAAGYGPSTGYGYGPASDYLRSEPARGEMRGRNFSGRGPRSYRRSEDRIKEDVIERLTRHPDLDASDIDVRVESDTVVLTGVVEDRKAKRLAEDIAEDVWGAEDVRNELKVRHGFLASLTGEQADEREITRQPVRDTSETSRRTTSGRTATGSTAGTTTE